MADGSFRDLQMVSQLGWEWEPTGLRLFGQAEGWWSRGGPLGGECTKYWQGVLWMWVMKLVGLKLSVGYWRDEVMRVCPFQQRQKFP